MQVNLRKARDRLSELLRRAGTGEEIVIARRGRPVARLVPVRPSRPQQSGKGNGRAIIAWLDSHPLPPYARRSEAEIDAAIVEERKAWD